MEASNGAHYWARVLSGFGHQVRLISPQFVAPYVKSNKNDRNDAEAICEAAGRPTMRFVPVKSVDQLAVQALHRIRSRLVSGRTRLANQIRGILAEHGIVIARNIAKLRQNLTYMIEGDGNGLGSLVRALVGELKAELAELDQRIAAYDRRIRELYRNNELCQRLGKIEGVGPLSATALMAAVGDRQGFKNGRQFAAWLGLVPKQRSSGGPRSFVWHQQTWRLLPTHLADPCSLARAKGKQDPRSLWLEKLRERRHPNIAAVALANKNARIAWALLSSGEAYNPSLSVGST